MSKKTEIGGGGEGGRKTSGGGRDLLPDAGFTKPNYNRGPCQQGLGCDRIPLLKSSSQGFESTKPWHFLHWMYIVHWTVLFRLLKWPRIEFSRCEMRKLGSSKNYADFLQIKIFVKIPSKGCAEQICSMYINCNNKQTWTILNSSNQLFSGSYISSYRSCKDDKNGEWSTVKSILGLRILSLFT